VPRLYPSDPGLAGLKLFKSWFGGYYARSLAGGDVHSEDGVLTTEVSVGRRWTLAITVLNTLLAGADLQFEAARAAIEQRLDHEGRSIALWAPRGAPLPVAEPGLSEIALAIANASSLEDGRLEVRRPVELYLRRIDTTGSVITVLGGLSGHWAQFTNRVPGSFQLNSGQLFRLPASQEERDDLADRIVLAAGQPGVDDTEVIRTEDCWTANDLEEGGSYVLGTPEPETDEQSAALRRTLRSLLRKAAPGLRQGSPDARALVVLGAATYAEEEKLSWALRGMDPTLYAGYDILAVVADGVVKPLLQPGRSTLPWDAPLA
jgi:hypothetical protein